MFVPVVDKDQKPLMPTTPARARKWIASGKATPFWKKGVFCVRLNVPPSDTKTQEIVIGIDPGSKREAFTVKSKAHTFLNVLADAVTWVEDRMVSRKKLRVARRRRNTPYRICRSNRHVNLKFVPPSTKARWQLKVRVVNWLRKMFPVVVFVVEDMKTKTTGMRKWDVSFGPLQTGKNWFYERLQKWGLLELKRGYETKELREVAGLKKTHAKMSETFDAHNVDTWVLANWKVGGHTEPDNREIVRVIPLNMIRRQLYYVQPKKGGKRGRFGGMMSFGFKRGSVVDHVKYGICYIGGNAKGRVTLHSQKTGERISRHAKVSDTRFRAFSSFRSYVVKA